MRLILLIAVAVGLAGCEAETPKAPEGRRAETAPGTAAEAEQASGQLDRSHAGKAAPDALFQDPEGETASIRHFRGRPVLVNLWATWCAPCIAEMPTLDALAERESGIEVLTISQDLNGKEKVDAFFEKRNFRMIEPYLDSELTLMTELGITTLPTTILYDAEGREVWRMTGMEDWTGPRAARLIAEASKA